MRACDRRKGEAPSESIRYSFRLVRYGVTEKAGMFVLSTYFGEVVRD
jgi:hypothetical protein